MKNSKIYSKQSKNKNKLHAQKTVVDGIEFDSKKEAERYYELKILEIAGKISDLQIQVKFELVPAQYGEVTEYTPKTHQKRVKRKLLEREIAYYADFVYTDENGNRVVEDVKGYRDPSSAAFAKYVLKRKLMLFFHGIRIKEV